MVADNKVNLSEKGSEGNAAWVAAIGVAAVTAIAVAVFSNSGDDVTGGRGCPSGYEMIEGSCRASKPEYPSKKIKIDEDHDDCPDQNYCYAY